MITWLPLLQTRFAMRSAPGRWTVAALLILMAGNGCAHTLSSEDLELYVPVGSYDFDDNPQLLDRILAAPYGYFRFVNERFTLATCARFAPELDDMPLVNLHGDGHVGQYSVTETGRGLADFDDASVGPAVVDLVRVGVSIELLADQKGWAEHKTALVGAFLAGYRVALRDPETVAEEPRVVGRIRSQFGSDRRPLLAWADSLMDPEGLPSTPVQELIGPFAEAILRQHPELPSTYFEVKKAGRHRLGVGSALDEKYLIRVEGPTAAPEDDVLVEIKEVRDLSAIPCIERRPSDPGPILNAQSRIAYEPYRFTGSLHVGDRSFWLHTWVDHYYEISDDDVQDLEEATEILFDVGVQLGRGHPKAITSDDAALRRAQLESLNRYQEKIERAIDELAVEVVRAWKVFCVEAGR